MKQPKVSIVVLNWNGKQDTLECLESIKKLDYPNFDVILVDNGSIDGSQKVIKKAFPKVHLLQNKVNLGFTGGNNVGIEYALKNNAEYVMLLNNDTTVEKNLLMALLEPFKQNSTIGLTGPKVVYYDEPARTWCAGCNYNPLIGKGKMYGSKNKDAFMKPRYVDWISFCVVLIKREVLEQIGPLDDDYFSSYEDLDFCLKATKKGFRCFYTPNTKVYHKIARDWKGLSNPLYVYYQTRNNLLCLSKNRKHILYLLSLMHYLGLSISRRSLSFIKSKETRKIKYIFMGIYDFVFGNFGIGKLSAKIKKQFERSAIIKIGLNARYLQRRMTGIERYISELIKNVTLIDDTKQFVLFFCGHEPIPDLKLSKNVSTYISRKNTKNRSLRIIWEQFLLAKELKENQISLFHGPSFVAPLLKPCKYVVTVHDLSYYLFPKSLTGITRLYFSVFLPYSLKKADKIIADSHSTKKDIMRLFRISETKIKVIHLGIDKLYTSVKNKRFLGEIKTKYNLPQKFILFTGMLSPRKNLPRMLRAFSSIKKNGWPHKFVIVGAKGWLYDSIFAQVKKLNLEKEVIFTEYVPDKDLPAFYTLADLFMFSTLYEGFGLPILEAMACGCPVVTSTTSSMPEVAGKAALLVNPRDTKAIADAIESILRDKKLRNKLIKRGFRQIQNFSWKKTAKETLKIYEEVLAS